MGSFKELYEDFNQIKKRQALNEAWDISDSVDIKGNRSFQDMFNELIDGFKGKIQKRFASLIRDKAERLGVEVDMITRTGEMMSVHFEEETKSIDIRLKTKWDSGELKFQFTFNGDKLGEYSWYGITLSGISKRATNALDRELQKHIRDL